MVDFEKMTSNEIAIMLEKGFKELNKREAALKVLTGECLTNAIAINQIKDWPLHDLLASIVVWDAEIPETLQTMREQMGLDEDGMAQAVSDQEFDYHVAQAGWRYYA